MYDVTGLNERLDRVNNSAKCVNHFCQQTYSASRDDWGTCKGENQLIESISPSAFKFHPSTVYCICTSLHCQLEPTHRVSSRSQPLFNHKYRKLINLNFSMTRQCCKKAW